MKELKDGNCYPCMGCRSFLTVYHDENNKPKFYGRFNQCVVTINLVDVACSSGKDKDRFWKIFDERLEQVSSLNTLQQALSDNNTCCPREYYPLRVRKSA